MSKISVLPEITTVANSDWLVVLTSAGVTSKVKKSNLGFSTPVVTSPTLPAQLKALCDWSLLLTSENVSLVDGYVSAWIDQNTVQTNAFQNTAAARTLLLSGTLPSGKNSLNFTGSQYLDFSAINAKNKSLFILAKYKNTSLSDSYLMGNSSGSNMILGYDTGGSNLRIFSGNSTYLNSPSYTSVKDSWKLFELSISTANVATFLLNGVAATPTPTLSSDFNPSRIGGYSSGRYFTGEMAFVGVANTIDSTIRGNIRAAIASWSGVTI